jgi:endoglucanase
VFEGDGGDVPAAPLKPVGRPVDVEGGWFDAGDFVKFTHATAYSVAELLVVQRGLHRRDRALAAETRHGLRWLDKVWDERHRVLYAQVGLGTGSERFGFLGDHDVWRLPEADDALAVRPGDPGYFLKYRPVFRAAPPGAGPAAGRRLSVRHGPDDPRRRAGDRLPARLLPRRLLAGRHGARGRRAGPGGPAAARPAGRRLAAGRHPWAARYLGSDHRDALNLYDTSALAHTDLVRALRRGRRAAGLEVGPATWSPTCGASWTRAPGRPAPSPSARRWT